MSFAIQNTNIVLDNTAVTIPTPSAGQTVIYPKADKLLYYKDDAGVERLVNVTAAIIAGYMLVRDEKSIGTAGGSATAGTNTRTLNTVVNNTITGASLSSNQITLPIGTYIIDAFAPTINSNGQRAYLYNITGGSVILLGSTHYVGSADNVTTHSRVIGRFTISATTVFELRQWVETATNANTLGSAANRSEIGVEIYSTVQIIKES